jgi:hypothetical protein
VSNHWFDELSKNAARAFATRSSAPPLQLRKTMSAKICGRRRSDSLVIREVSLSRGNVTYSARLAYDVTARSSQASTKITDGTAMVVNHDVVAAENGSVTVTTTYGRGVRGAKRLTMSSKNGKAFQGSLDKRTFSLARIGQSTRLEFADGKPAPKVVVTPKLASTINALDLEIKKSLSSCGSVMSVIADLRPQPSSSWSPPSQPAPARRPSSQPRSRRARPSRAVRKRQMKSEIPPPGSGWYLPDEEDNGSCLDCEDGCNSDFADETTSWGCLISLGSCWPAALAKWGVCMGLCRLPGGGCLPVPCGTFTTCAEGDTCFGSNLGDFCCPGSSAVCHGACCGWEISNCAPDGSCGCRESETACGNNCCDPDDESCIDGICCKKGQTVLNGVCCDPVSVCGNVCCDVLSSCADKRKGLCCGFAHPVCGSQCCEIGAQCINGKCCPADRLCGGVCCPTGQTCLDPKTHKCMACRGGMVPCRPEGGPGLCCPPNVDCCIGVCCKPGEVCNIASVVNGNVTYACGPPEIPK